MSWMILIALSTAFGGEPTETRSGEASAPEPPRLELSAGFERLDPHPSFHVGQAIGTSLLASAVVLEGLGLALLIDGDGYGAYAGIASVTLGGIAATIGTGAALGATASLNTDDLGGNALPGVIALGAAGVGVGLLAVGLVTNEFDFAYGAMAAAPVVTGFGLTQVIVNAADARRRPGVALGIRPMRDGGAMTAMALRF